MNPPQVYMCSPSCTLLPPPSPYHPSGSCQCTSPKHPVSCIEPGLVICFIYDIIHVSMPLSQIVPPSPSPTESKILFYTSVSMGSLRLDTTERLHFHFSLSCIGEGNDNPVFLPGESQGWGSLVGCCLWGHTESDTTEET